MIAPAPDTEADVREYQRKLRIIADRIERWRSYHRQRNRLDGPGGTSILYRLAAEASEGRRRKKRGEPNPWVCTDCEQIHQAQPKRCRRCGRGVFYRPGQGVSGKKVSAAIIPGTSPGRDWIEEMATDDAIRGMPAPLRRVIKLNYLDWRSQEAKCADVGHRGISVATFGSRLAMAHQYLIGYGDARGWFLGRVC